MTKFVNYIEKLPRDNNYVYHRTHQKNIDSILLTGINNTIKVKEWIELNKFLTYVAKQYNISNKPINRANCIFTYPRFADIANINSNYTAILAINLNYVEGNIYRASYHKATKINEKLTSLSEDKNNQSLVNMALEYWNHMEKCSRKIKRGGEVLIDSEINSNAISHIYK